MDPAPVPVFSGAYRTLCHNAMCPRTLEGITDALAALTRWAEDVCRMQHGALMKAYCDMDPAANPLVLRATLVMHLTRLALT